MVSAQDTTQDRHQAHSTDRSRRLLAGALESGKNVALSVRGPHSPTSRRICSIISSVAYNPARNKACTCGRASAIRPSRFARPTRPRVPMIFNPSHARICALAGHPARHGRPERSLPTRSPESLRAPDPTRQGPAAVTHWDESGPASPVSGNLDDAPPVRTGRISPDTAAGTSTVPASLTRRSVRRLCQGE